MRLVAGAVEPTGRGLRCRRGEITPASSRAGFVISSGDRGSCSGDLGVGRFGAPYGDLKARKVVDLDEDEAVERRPASRTVASSASRVVLGVSANCSTAMPPSGLVR
jgi:hypothetical protein